MDTAQAMAPWEERAVNRAFTAESTPAVWNTARKAKNAPSRVLKRWKPVTRGLRRRGHGVS